MQPDATAEWMAFARGDLALAGVTPPRGVPLALICFHAQQAAEKALKAVLVFHGAEVPRIHDIVVLIDLVEALVLVPPSLHAAGDLSAYATRSRYPGDSEPVMRAELARAVRLARDVVEAAALWTGA